MTCISTSSALERESKEHILWNRSQQTLPQITLNPQTPNAYSPRKVDRIWGIWGSYYTLPKAIFHLLTGDYKPKANKHQNGSWQTLPEGIVNGSEPYSKLLIGSFLREVYRVLLWGLLRLNKGDTRSLACSSSGVVPCSPSAGLFDHSHGSPYWPPKPPSWVPLW